MYAILESLVMYAIFESLVFVKLIRKKGVSMPC